MPRVQEQESQIVAAQIDEEVSERSAENAKSSLQKHALRAERPELERIITEGNKVLVARKDEEGQRALAILGTLLGAAFSALEDAIQKHGMAAPGQQRYSPAAREASATLFARVNKTRGTVGKRLTRSAIAEEIREGCGIGKDLTADAPMDVLDTARRQRTTLAVPKNKTLLVARGVPVDRMVADLDKLIPALEREIAGGVAKSPRKGEVSQEVQTALLRLDVILSRIATVLDEGDASEAAEALERRLPRTRPGRRSTDPVDGDGDALPAIPTAPPAEPMTKQ